MHRQTARGAAAVTALAAFVAAGLVLAGCGETSIDTSGGSGVNGGDNDTTLTDTATDTSGNAGDSGAAASDAGKKAEDAGSAGGDVAKTPKDAGSGPVDVVTPPVDAGASKDAGSSSNDTASGGDDTATGGDDTATGGDDSAGGADDGGTGDASEADAGSASDAAGADTAGCVKTKPPTEVCDGIDNDCDGKTDNADAAKPLCSDGKACTKDMCAGKDGCKHPTDDGAGCDDGDKCTSKDTCKGGACTAGPATDCNDGNVCTADSCDKSSGCVNKAATGGTCDDGNPCTTADACKDGTCVSSGTKDCSDNKPCTDDTCKKETGKCEHTNNTAACDDGDKCTTKDTCKDGKCAAGPKTDCDDKNVCTTDSCDPKSTKTGPKGGCVNAAGNNGGKCDDGSACTSGDACAAGKCVGKAKSCDDGDSCTKDACDAKTGKCSNTKIAGCVPKCKKDADCDDKNACTIDICNVATGGCDDKNAPLGTPCGNAMVCDGVGSCSKAKPCTSWDITFGLHEENPKVSNGTESNGDVIAASDGTVYSVGYTREAAISYRYDGSITAHTADGKFAWHTRWGNAGKRDYLDAGVGRDDGIWAVGRSESSGSKGSYDGLALYVDKSGKVKTATFIAGTYNSGKHVEELHGAIAMPNNGLLACGRAYNGSTSYDPFVARIDKDGKVVKATAVKSTGTDTVTGCAHDKKTGNNVLSGTNGQYFGGVWIVDKDDKLKTWVTLTAKYRFLLDAVVTSKGKYAGIGYDTAPSASEQGLVAFFDADGKNIKKALFGGSSTDRFIAGTPDASGGVFVAGTTRSYGAHASTTDAWVMRVSEDGKTIGRGHYFGGTGSDQLQGIDNHPQGGLVVAGSTYDSKNAQERWTMRLSEFGALVCPGTTVTCKNGNYCDDGKTCTAEVCDTKTGKCTNPKIPGCCLGDGHCDDGKFCTTDGCDVLTNRCKAPVVKADCCDADGQCDDKNACSKDTCDLKTHKCGHAKVAGCCHIDVQCDDKNSCTKDSCVANTCQNLSTCCKQDTDCKAPNGCWVSKCDVGSGKCSLAPSAKCDDKNACTVDWCDPKTGACTNKASAKGIPCGKDMACDGAGKCVSSACNTFWTTFGTHQEKDSSGYYTSSERAGSVSATADGGGWFTESARTKAISYYSGRLVRRDGAGKVLSATRTTRTKTNVHHFAEDVATAADGGAFVIGRSADNGTKGGYDIWVWRFDKDGKQVGQANHGSTSTDEGWKIETTAKGAVGVGTTYTSATRNDGVVLWLDSAGKITKTATFGQLGGLYDYGYGVGHDLKSGNTLAVGFSSTPTKGNEGLLALFDGSGKRLAQQWIGGPATSSDRLYAAAALPGGGFVACGQRPFNGENQGWVVKTDAALKTLTQHEFGRPQHSEYARDIAVLNGSIVVVGEGSSSWLQRLGLDLKPLGDLRIIDKYSSGFRGVAQAVGGGILLAGRTRQFVPGKSDYNALHIKLAQDGGVACPGKPVKCVGAEMCDDGKICTTDSCDTKTGACSHKPVAGCCSSNADCSDSHPCTVNTCTHGKCSFPAAPANTPCGGGKLCTESGGCGCTFINFIEDSSDHGNPLKQWASDTLHGVGGDGAGGTFVVGATYTGSNIGKGERYQDGYVVRRDNKGKAVWRKWVGGKYRDYVNTALVNKGRAWGAGNNYTSTSSSTSKGWVFAFDATGKQVVDARFGDRYTQIYSMAPAGDGVVLGGRVRTTNYYGGVVQLDSKGQLTGVKLKALTKPGLYAYVRGVAWLPDSKKVAAVGYSYKGSKLRDEAYLALVDGNTETFVIPKSHSGYDRFWAVTAHGKGVIAAGQTQSGPSGTGYQAWLVFTDAAGKLTSQAYYGGTGTESLRRVATGTVAGKAVIVAAGETTTSTAGGYDGYIIVTDGTGKLLVSKTMGGTSTDRLYSCAIVGDTIHAAGEYRSAGTKSNDWWHYAMDIKGSQLCL